MAAPQFNVEEVFLQAVQQAPADRPAFLDATCADSKVRTRVEALLKANDTAGDFLDSPAVQSAPLPGTQAPPAHESGPHLVPESLDFLDRCDTPGRLGRLAHYEILEIIGHGGMGIVLRGVDGKLNRVVALKVLAPQLAANAMARKRFLREAQAAAAVSHDHVVAIHAVDEFKGLPYLVMEYVSGASLQQKIEEQGALQLAQILRIGMQIASGLAAAHAQGLVHRDIKPANILLENGIERVKITDFGLARSVDDVRMTQSGVVHGTPLYMSPEQAQGERVEQGSDLFSLGSVLYMMCSGRPPFCASTTMGVLLRVVQNQPCPLQEINPDVPPWLSDLIAKLHAKKPAERYASAREVAELLERHLSELQRPRRVEALGETRPLPTPTSAGPEAVADQRPKAAARSAYGRRWVAAAAAILVLLAGFGLSEATGVTNVRGTVIRLLSPEGTLVVEVDDPDVSVRIDGAEMVITGTGAKEIRLKPGEYKLVASKDGKPVTQELVTVTKNGRQVVRVSQEGQAVALGNQPPAPVAAKQDRPVPAPPLAKAPFDAQRAREHQEAWAKYLGVPVETTNALGMKFRLIPPGEFTMGVTDAEAEPWPKFHEDAVADGKRAVPAHTVRLTRPFYLGEREVRYREFLDLLKRQPGNQPKHPDQEADDVLMSQCTWLDCIAFCNRLSEREGRTPAYQVAGQTVTVTPGATGYRLPTEAEWEFACRAGTTSLWYFGWTVQEAEAMCVRSIQEGAAYLRARTALPNPFGLVGMYAGSSEWCWDWYAPSYYRECADRGVVVDPQGPDAGEERMIRGGQNYAVAGGDLRGINSAAREPRDPIRVAWDKGFGRIVLPIPLPGARRGDPLAGWLGEVAALPAAEQVKAVAAKLKDLNPGFDGQVTPQIVDGVVTQLAFVTDRVTNITPLRALTGLTHLYCGGSTWAQGQLADLEPLRGMRLTHLGLFANRGVADLSPLVGMKLISLGCSGTLVTDLEPLRGMPLEDLECRECQGIQSLAPLQGMLLKRLDCSRAHVTDLSPLRGMPLDCLAISCTQVADLSPLRGMKLTTLGCRETKVTDLSVVRGIPVKNLWWNFQAERDAAILRSLEALERINDKPVAEFWKEVDAQPAAQQP